jgi:DNA-directed RNA polymerase subunit RPC12/RpoP
VSVPTYICSICKKIYLMENQSYAGLLPPHCSYSLGYMLFWKSVPRVR